MSKKYSTYLKLLKKKKYLFKKILYPNPTSHIVTFVCNYRVIRHKTHAEILKNKRTVAIWKFEISEFEISPFSKIHISVVLTPKISDIFRKERNKIYIR